MHHYDLCYYRGKTDIWTSILVGKYKHSVQEIFFAFFAPVLLSKKKAFTLNLTGFVYSSLVSMVCGVSMGWIDYIC